MRDLRDYLLGTDWSRPTTDASKPTHWLNRETEAVTREVEVMTEARVRAIVAQVLEERMEAARQLRDEARARLERIAQPAELILPEGYDANGQGGLPPQQLNGRTDNRDT